MEKPTGVSACGPKGLWKGQLANIEDGLELSVSDQVKERISGILESIESLSDVEKLLLYLKLPTGSASEDVLRQTPTSFLHASNRLEQAQAFTWIRSHLEEDSQICVPKHEVYDDYRSYCESHGLKSLCAADFGKVLKCIFPNVKPRRLGQRGQSRYCYSGLRKKLDIQPPSLPELEISPKKPKTEDLQESELFSASCQLVCEWAGKLLSRAFGSLRELSEYLVGNLYVNSKSSAAFTVLAAMQEAGLHNSRVPVSPLFTCSSGGDKHRETQLQLQRKLQERELLKEQKKKLQQQRSEIEQEQLRSTSRGPTATPTKSPLPRSFSKTPTPIKSPVNLRPPSSLAMKSPGPQVTFRQTPTPTSQLQNASKCAARNITKLLQSPVQLGKPAPRSQDVKSETADAGSVSLGERGRAVTSEDVAVAAVVGRIPTTASTSSSLSPPSSTAFAPAQSISHMQTDAESSDSSTATLTDRTSQAAVLLSTVNGMNIVAGNRQFIFSGRQGLILDDPASSSSTLVKNGLHVVQKPLVVGGTSSQLTSASTGLTLSQQQMASMHQMQTLQAASASDTVSNTGNMPAVSKLETVTVGQGITIVSKSKDVSADRSCGEIESIAPSDLDRCRVENINYIPGNLSTRSAFVPVSNQKLAFTLISPSVGRVLQTSESSSDESKDQDDSLPMDQSEALGHSGGFEPQTFTSKTSDPSLGPSAMQTSDSSSSGQSSSGIPTPSQLSQKKTKNRFTPIRPKASQTVTSFQKDQKTPEKDSRPVSALLKEKRAREAKGVFAHVASMQGEAGTGRGFPSSISLPAEMLGLSPNRTTGGNDVVIILTSPSTGTARFLPTQREHHGATEDKQPQDKNTSITHSMMSDFLMANPNFLQHRELAAQSQSKPQTVVMSGAEMMEVSASQTKPSVVVSMTADHNSGVCVQGAVRRDSGGVDVSDSSEMDNTTDEEVTQHMAANPRLLMPENRDMDTPSSRKRKSSGQGNADQTNKRLNSADKRIDNHDDDDVFIVEHSPDLPVEIRGEMKPNSSGQTVFTFELPVHQPVKRQAAGSPYVRPGSSADVQMHTGEPVSRCQSTGVGDEPTAPVFELPRHVRGKLNVESLENDALLDSGHVLSGRDLLKHPTATNPTVQMEQRMSVGTSAKTRAATQQALLLSKQELDDRLRPLFSRAQDLQSVHGMVTVSDIQRVTATATTITSRDAGIANLSSSDSGGTVMVELSSGIGAGLLEPRLRLSENMLNTSTSSTHLHQVTSGSGSRLQDASMNVDTFSQQLGNIPSSIFELMQNFHPSGQSSAAGTDVRGQGSVHRSIQQLLVKGTENLSPEGNEYNLGVSSSFVPSSSTQTLSQQTPSIPSLSLQQVTPDSIFVSSQTAAPISTQVTTVPSAAASKQAKAKPAPAPAPKSGPTQPVNLLALLKSPALSALDKPSTMTNLLLSRELNLSKPAQPKQEQPAQSKESVSNAKVSAGLAEGTSAKPAQTLESGGMTSAQGSQLHGRTTKISPNVNISFLSGGTTVQSVYDSSEFSSSLLQDPTRVSEELPPNFLDQEPEGELPADVAEFVAEAMTARELKLQQNRESLLMLSAEYMQSFIQQSGGIQGEGSSGQTGSVGQEAGTFTMPSNPAPKQRLSESGTGAGKKIPPVQRSASLPGFVPRVPGMGIGVPGVGPGGQQDATSPVPSPPTGPVSSPRAPTPHSANTTVGGKPARRLRQTAVERGNTRTPSDAGYHSIDASPLMPTFTPLPPPSSTPNQDQISVNVATPVRRNTVSVRSDSAQSLGSEGLQTLPQGSPLAPASQGVLSTPSSVSCYSPVDPAVGSPNAFMPIQVSSASRSGGGVQQQYIEPIRPVVTLASASSSSDNLTMMLSAGSQVSTQTDLTRLSQGSMLSPEFPGSVGEPSPSVRSVSSDPGVDSSVGVSRVVSSSPRPGTVPYSALSPATPRGSYPLAISPGPSPTPGTSNACSPSPTPAAGRSASHGVLQKLLSTRSAPPSYAESLQQRRLSGNQTVGNQVISGTVLPPSLQQSDSLTVNSKRRLSGNQTAGLSGNQTSNQLIAGDRSSSDRSVLGSLAGETMDQHTGQFTVPMASAEDVRAPARSVIHHIPPASSSSSGSTTTDRSGRRIAILKRDSTAKPNTKSSTTPKVAAAASDSILKANLASPAGSSSSSEGPVEYPFSYKLALLRQQSMTQPEGASASATGSQPSGSSQSQSTASAVLAASLASLQKQVKSQSADSPGSSSETQSSGASTSNMGVQASSLPTSVSTSTQQQLSVPLRVSTSTQPPKDIFFGLPASSPSQRLNPFSPQQSSPSSTSSTSSIPLSSGLTLPSPGHPMGALYLPYNLPDMNYMGNAPNIDLSQLSFLSRKAAQPEAVTQPQPSSLSEPGFEDELQSTLDILRNIDGQYFNQEMEGEASEGDGTMMLMQNVFSDFSQEPDLQDEGQGQEEGDQGQGEEKGASGHEPMLSDSSP